MTATFDREASSRMPLADATLRLLDHAFAPDFLAEVFDHHRGRSYERELAFPTVVRLITDALLGHHGSAHQTFRHAQEEDHTLPVTVQAVYRKLSRIPLGLSCGLFAAAAARLREVGTPAIAHPLPESLAEFRVLAFDGKKLKYVAKRLKPLRGLKGNIFGGKLLVVQDLATQQAVAVEANIDGEAGDNPLVPPVVTRVRAVTEDPRLWIGDRAFCDYPLLHTLAEGADHFLIRFNSSCRFYADPEVPARTGVDDEKRPYHEQWGWLGKPGHPHRVQVRMITVERTDADPLVLVTSLAEADRYPAIDLLSVYRSRWGIETMFQQVVQTFDLRHLIGGTSHATVFQAVLGLLLYNITLIVRDHVAVAATREPKTVSTKLLFDDLVRDLTSWRRVIGVDGTVALLRSTAIPSPKELREYLAKILGPVWTNRWAKAETRKGRAATRPRAYLVGGHSSVDKILRGAHREILLTPGTKTNRKTRKKPPPTGTTMKDV